MVGSYADLSPGQGAYSNTSILGYGAIATDNNQVRLGNEYVQTMYCMGATAVTSHSPNMYVDPATGQIMRSSGTKIPQNGISFAGGVIEGLASMTITFRLEGAVKGNTMLVSPSEEMPDGIVIAYTRIKSENIAEIKLTNISNGKIKIPSMEFAVTLIN